ncbi:CREB/ATF bZIP transcription factor [Lates calcarifer]|uniref:X-box-binding protein 1 n=1 Tax=Lates calcarifer TaxID=8187 RepID=A0AAJ7VIH7_LATCA|nr:CREB/ATF bZIP transcription factor [Lates calcarifer]
MRTRSRSRVINITESPEVEVVDAMETAENLPSHFMEFLADNIDIGGLELDDLFGIEDFKWTLAKDTAGHHGQLLDMALADFGVNGAKDQDSGIEASTVSSPERSSNLRVKNTQSQSSRVINKNAIAARLNRLKKKAYVNSLEKKVGILSTENNVLKQKNDQLTKRVEELEDETRYLRAVLANESTLAEVLSSLSSVNGMKISSSLFQGADPNDHNYALPRKHAKVEKKETPGGVCLHVDKDLVSVEFCVKCAERASASLKT